HAAVTLASWSLTRSSTSRTARSRSSSGYFRAAPIVPLSRELGTSTKPGAIQVEDGFAGGKELAALDEHQVRSWTSWQRWTILALLAHAFLSVLASQAAGSHPGDAQLIPLTRHEIRRLLTGLSRQLPGPSAQLHW